MQRYDIFRLMKRRDDVVVVVYGTLEHLRWLQIRHGIDCDVRRRPWADHRGQADSAYGIGRLMRLPAGSSQCSTLQHVLIAVSSVQMTRRRWFLAAPTSYLRVRQHSIHVQCFLQGWREFDVPIPMAYLSPKCSFVLGSWTNGWMKGWMKITGQEGLLSPLHLPLKRHTCR